VGRRGPRQVGKTTLAQQIIQQLLDKGVPAHHILYVLFDLIVRLPTNYSISRLHEIQKLKVLKPQRGETNIASVTTWN